MLLKNYFFYEFIFSVVHFIGLLIPILILVAFITLLERKEIASMQRRRGPNVVGFSGLLQPIADGLKLILKEPVFPYNSNRMIFLVSPLISFSVSLAGFAVLPLGGVGSFLSIDLGVLYVLALSSLNVYGIVLSGWSSNSKYAFFGALRSSCQLISYEVSFSLSLLPVLIFCRSLNFECIINSQTFICFLPIFFISAISVYIAILAETNRTPFDLPEAEAELVAGYNVEYSSMFFALFYLAEYSSIVLMSTVFTMVFLGGWMFFGFSSLLFLAVKVILVIYSIIWVRATFPRYRFDQLIQVGWKVLLPLNMGVFVYSCGLFFFMFQMLLLVL